MSRARLHMATAMATLAAVAPELGAHMGFPSRPERGWKHDPARLSAAEAKRARRQARNLRNLVRS